MYRKIPTGLSIDFSRKTIVLSSSGASTRGGHNAAGTGRRVCQNISETLLLHDNDTCFKYPVHYLASFLVYGLAAT